MTKTVTAIFRTRQTTEEALRQLEVSGFSANHVSVLMSDDTRRNSFKIVENSKADEGLAAGATSVVWWVLCWPLPHRLALWLFPALIWLWPVP